MVPLCKCFPVHGVMLGAANHCTALVTLWMRIGMKHLLYPGENRLKIATITSSARFQDAPANNSTPVAYSMADTSALS